MTYLSNSPAGFGVQRVEEQCALQSCDIKTHHTNAPESQITSLSVYALFSFYYLHHLNATWVKGKHTFFLIPCPKSLHFHSFSNLYSAAWAYFGEISHLSSFLQLPLEPQKALLNLFHICRCTPRDLAMNEQMQAVFIVYQALKRCKTCT